MSFFGFDPTAPTKRGGQNVIDDFDEDDAFNEETFGADATNGLSNDFDFGFGANSSKSTLKPAISAPKQTISYAKAANDPVQEVLQPMASLWADEQQQQQQQQQQEQQHQHEEEKDKVYSMEEIESKLRVNDSSAANVPLFPFPPQIAQALCSPQVQQQMLAAVAQGRFPNIETATQAMIQMMLGNPQMLPPQPPMAYPGNIIPPQANPNLGVNITGPQFHQQLPIQQLQPILQHQHAQQVSPGSQHQKVDLNSMPTLAEAKNVLGNHHHHQLQQQQQPNFSQSPTPTPSSAAEEENSMFNNNNQHQHNRQQRGHFMNHHQRQLAHQQMIQQQLEQMTPEEREKFVRRQQKVARITRASGFMTPKDKDFVTRFQLSQIVTEDPYNEDFYAQVYKVLNSAINENDMNSLAQKYLDQSGHRLGGRSKRADIALQRMQQQVSKAVSVAKERGQRAGVLSREGALGKVFVGSSNAPRRQLAIKKEEQETSNFLPKEYSFSKSSRSFQLSIIEKIYNEVLKLESAEREQEAVDSSELWKSLHMNDVIKTSNNETLNPFISILSVNKTMKLFSRMFHFLNHEQRVELISLIFTNLQKLDVIFKGSYKNYTSNKSEVPKDVVQKIELFEDTIFKALVYYLSESDFPTVLNLMQTLIQNNNILIVCTTKIGLQLMTVLVSKLELIKQDYSNSLSASDLSQWTNTYDLLFQQLEGRLETLFPPYLSCRDGFREANADDSYIWQFLASLTLAGQLSHQRIIVGEVRDEIFGVQSLAQKMRESGQTEEYDQLLENLNLFLNVMGLRASESEISELE